MQDKQVMPEPQDTGASRQTNRADAGAGREKIQSSMRNTALNTASNASLNAASEETGDITHRMPPRMQPRMPSRREAVRGKARSTARAAVQHLSFGRKIMQKRGSHDETPESAHIPEVIYASETDGLTSGEVEARIAAGCVNTPISSVSKTTGQIFITNIFTYFNMLFCVLAAGIIWVRSWLNLTFMAVVFINTAIGIIQELRSKRELDKLSILSAPKGRAIRDEVEVSVDTALLVRDDIVIFRAGDQIYADAVVLSGSCKVNESLVTGEADEIDKSAADRLLSGSFVVSGSCRARLTAVGADSFASKLTLEAKRSKGTKKSEMMRSLSRLVGVIGIVVLPFGAALIIKEIKWVGRDTVSAVTSTVGALIGMIPEGLYLLTSLALVAGVLRLARKRTLVHELACIETLARVDTLCVDKTGTITENKMTADGVIPLCPDRFSESDIKMIMTDYVNAMPRDNETMEALFRCFSAEPMCSAIDTLQFSSVKKYGGVTFENEMTYLLGAPEILLGAQYASYSGIIEGYAGSGKRVLLLSLYYGGLHDPSPNHASLPIALITLTNKIRPEAPDTFKYFVDQGVTVKVISGDNPVTVAEVAKSAGIEGAERCVDARILTTDEEIAAAAEKYIVFGRVTPAQKRKLVIAMKSAGHTVAMTGDGVNDVLALKEADCSVAMASGSEVACQVSHIVLMDSNFSAMPSVVMEGRRVINNIERSASLFLVKNIFSFALAFITLFFTLPYPFSPSQLTLVNVLTIGIPSFVLAMEPNESRVKGRFLSKVLYRALPAAMADLVLIIGVLLFYKAFDLNDGSMTTICTAIMGIVGLHMVDRSCRPYKGNKIRIALIVSMTVMFFTALLFLRRFFMLSSLLWSDILILVSLALLAGPAVDFIAKWLDILRIQINKLVSKRKRHIKKRA